MSDKLIWASEAAEPDILAPSAEKIAQGWLAEVPPHEYFNWHMNRTDKRLVDLETPVQSAIAAYISGDRTEPIPAHERFDLPRPYVVGGKHLRVFLDGILCEPGEENQYVECGQPGTESTYIRFNDLIPADFTIRIEIPIRCDEPVRWADEAVVAQVEDLITRVGNLEAPTFCKRHDSPAGTRQGVIPADSVYVLPDQYLVGSDQLQVYINGVLQYEGKDYFEQGTAGEWHTDIKFARAIPVSDNIRVFISIKAADATTVLNEAVSLEALKAMFVRNAYRENRMDETVSTRIEALAEYTVPEYTVGDNGLKVYKNGLLLVKNRDYSENGIEGETSTKIIWNSSVEAGTIISVTAPKPIVLE